jgi:hypothetical protein
VVAAAHAVRAASEQICTSVNPAHAGEPGFALSVSQLFFCERCTLCKHRQVEHNTR